MNPNVNSQAKSKSENFKAGFVGLIGQPNAGKSTLMNYLIEQKVSIVTSKPQTTRRRILGIQNTDHAQIVFVDAPGLVKAEKGLNAFLEKEALEVISESDVLIAVLSLDEKDQADIEKVLNLVKDAKRPWMGIVTKTDIAEKAHRLLIIKHMVEEAGGVCHTISAVRQNKEDREELLKQIESLLPSAPAPLYDKELFTTENVRQLASEIIREKCFENLVHEIPYQIAILVRKFEEDAKPCPKVYVDVIVAKDSHKAIVIGKKAELIKKISQESRLEIEKLMQEKIYLELKVVVKNNWFEQNMLMKELGYIINDNK